MLRPRLLPAAALAAIVAPSLWLAWQGRDLPSLGRRSDDALYLASALSLTRDSGYRILSLPDEPFQTKLPPLYPALLALAWKLWPGAGSPVEVALLATWLALPVWLLVARRTIRDLGVGPAAAWGLTALAALHPHTLRVSLDLASELPGCALLLAALLTAEAALKRTSRAGLWAAAAGLLGALAYLTRSAALPLFFAAPLWFLWRKRPWLAAGFACAMAPAVAGWTLWARAHLAPGADPWGLFYTDYLGFYLLDVHWSDLPALLRTNTMALLGGCGALIAPNPGVGLPRIPWLVLGALAIFGTARLGLRRGFGHYHAFAALFAVQLLFWNYPPWERFLLPIYPLLLAGFFSEMKLLVEFLRRDSPPVFPAARSLARAASVALAAAAGAAIALTGSFLLGIPEFVAQDRERLARNRKAYEWIVRNTSADAAFLSQDDAFHVYTGRRSTRLPILSRTFWAPDRRPLLEQIARVEEFANRSRLDYVIATPEDFEGELLASERDAYRKRLDCSRVFRQVLESDGVTVYARTAIN